MEDEHKYTLSFRVEEKHLAINIGSGDVPVLASPVLFMFMEQASMRLAEKSLPEGSTTVGSFLSATHLKPSIEGKKIYVTSELVQKEGRKLLFKAQAFEEENIIGEGTHIRYIVDKEQFLQKTLLKKIETVGT